MGYKGRIKLGLLRKFYKANKSNTKGVLRANTMLKGGMADDY